MLRQPIVQERVPRVEELRKRPILAQDVLKEHPCLGLHRVAQVRTPVGELLRIGFDAVQVPRFQPLPGEVVRQRRRTGIGEQPLHLGVERRRRAELARLGQPEQLVVRHRAPQEITQPRRQLEIGNLMDLRRVRRIVLYAKQKMRRHQHRLNRQLNSLLGALPLGLRHRGEFHERRDVALRDRPPVRSPRERRDNLLGARRARLRIADENLLSARLLHVCRERTDEGHRF